MTHNDAVIQVFGSLPNVDGEGGYTSTLRLLVACARQLAELNVKVHLATLVGRPAIYVTLPWFNHKFLLPTMSVPRVGPSTVTEEDLEWAQYAPTSFCKYASEGVACLLPTFPHPNNALCEGGERVIRLHEVPIGKDFHQVPILILPNLLPLTMKDTELVTYQKAQEGRGSERKLIKRYADSVWQIANALCRDNGSETSILNWWSYERAVWKRLFPYQQNPGELMEALATKDGLIGNIASARIEGGGSYLIMGDSTLGIREIIIPQAVMLHLADESAKWGVEVTINVGDTVILTRRPFCVPMAFTIKGTSNDLVIRMHPAVAERQESDFDGDAVDMKPIPQHLDISQLWPDVVLGSVSYNESHTRVAYPKRFTVKPKETLHGMVASKGLIGMGATVARTIPNMAPLLRDMDWTTLQIDLRAISKALGEVVEASDVEPLRKMQDFGTVAGRIFAEAVVNKTQNITVDAMFSILNRAKEQPYDALRELVAHGGIFHANRYAFAMLCVYLSTLPQTYQELCDGVDPQQQLIRSAHAVSKVLPQTLEALAHEGIASVLR